MPAWITGNAPLPVPTSAPQLGITGEDKLIWAKLCQAEGSHLTYFLCGALVSVLAASFIIRNVCIIII